ncbi:transglycosylase SLT domain-containing protein, partial [Streptomyces sp. NPDC005093]
MKLTYAQLQTLWTSNGGAKALAPIMAAIALAESGGRTDAMNTKAPDYSVGLWQINYFGAMMPGRTKAYGSPSQLIADPNRQAKAAISILKGQGLRAWSTYTNGAYRKYADGTASSPLPNLDQAAYAQTLPAAGAGGVQSVTLQQAGYDAVLDITPWGIPVNPFKLPGWLGGKLGDAAGGAVKGFAWDSLGPLVL